MCTVSELYLGKGNIHSFTRFALESFFSFVITKENLDDQLRVKVRFVIIIFITSIGIS